MKKVFMAFGFALTTLAGFSQTVVDIIVNSEDHNYLEAAVIQQQLAGTLSDTTTSFTVFAPTDDAFLALAYSFDTDIDGLLALQNLTDILLYHVVGGNVLSTDLTNGMEATALNGGTLTFTIDTMGVEVSTAPVGPAMVIAADIIADNGVVHVIDAVLAPVTPTSITELENKVPQNNIYYNTMGQEINSYDQIPFNSIYIKNGKKFIKIEG